MASIPLFPTTLFGHRLIVSPTDLSRSLPLAYRDAFALRSISFESLRPGEKPLDFLLLSTITQPSLRLLEGALRAVRARDGRPCALYCPSLSAAAKDELGRRGIAYIQDAGNAYLPFVGAMATRSVHSRGAAMLSAQATRIFVDMLAGLNRVSAGELAELLDKSPASVTQYLTELQAICPGIVKKDGRYRYLDAREFSCDELLDTFGPYLCEPVRRVYSADDHLTKELLLEAGALVSGESALSFFSDLAVDASRLVVALDTKRLKALRAIQPVPLLDARRHPDAPLMIEEWAFPIDVSLPAAYAHFGLACVHPAALYVSLMFERNDDVRFQSAVEQLREAVCA